MFQWFSRFFRKSRPVRKSSTQSNRQSLTCENLEDRMVPAGLPLGRIFLPLITSETAATNFLNHGTTLPLNHAPAGTDSTKTTNEDTAVALSQADFGFTDPNDNPTNTLFAVKIVTLPTNGNLTLNGAPVAVNQSIAASSLGNLTFTPAGDFNGNASFTFQVQDNGGVVNGGVDLDPTPNTLTISVLPVNDAPSFVAGPGNNSITENAPALTVPNWATSISAGPANESNQNLTFVVTNNTNPSLFAVGPAVAPNGTLTYQLAPNQSGNATITLRLQDDGGTANGGVNQSATQNFTITVTPLNSAPSGTNNTISINEDSNLTFNASMFGFSDANDSPANSFLNVKITTTPGNGILLANGNVVLPGQIISVADINAGNLTFTPLANENGLPYANLTFQVQDNGGTANGGIDTDPSAKLLTINVNPVNDAPSFTAGSNQTVLEDAGLQTVPNWATSLSKGPANESSQNLSFSVSTSNTSLFLTPPSISSNGTLSYQTAANLSGTATITVVLRDDGGTANGGANASQAQNFTITVTPVNDAPSFTAGSNQSASEDAGLQTVTNWATSISPGAPDENGQNLTFNVTNSNTALFAVQPSVSSNGTLTYQSAANMSGTANITVVLRDDGGTANGGANVSQTQNFTITINDVNHAPTGTDNLLTITQTSNHTFNTTDFGFADPHDTPPDSLQNVTITTTPSAGNLTLNGVDVTANQSISLAQINAGQFVYTPSGNQSGLANFTFQVQDDGGTANGGVDLDPVAKTFTFDVDAAPVLAPGIATNLTFIENGNVALFGGGPFTVSDDNDQIDSATLTIGAGYNSTQDRLSFAGAGNITASAFNTTTGTLTLTGIATAAEYQSALQNVTYTNLSDDPTIDDRIVSLVVNDGIQDSNLITRTINVTAVNDAPVVTHSAASATFIIGNVAGVLVDANLNVSDVDSTLLTGATVTIVGNFAPGEDSLDAISAGNITITADNANGTLFLTGTDTVARYKAVLQTVFFDNNNATAANGETRELAYLVDDGITVSNAANITVQFSTNGTLAPVILPSLADDTGISPNDFYTSNATVFANLTIGASNLTAFRAGFDTVTAPDYTDILGDLNNGNVTLDLNRLQTINQNVALTDGIHTLLFYATDADNNLATGVISFTLDRTAPAAPTLTLSPDFDSGTQGDLSTIYNSATLIGTKDANTFITLQVGGNQTSAFDANTNFSLTDAALPTIGNNTFSAVAVDQAGNTSNATLLTVVRENASLQVVKAVPDTFQLAANGNLALTLNYDTDPSNANLAGLGLRLYFNATMLENANVTSPLTQNLTTQGIFADTNDDDNDPNTTFYIQTDWTDVNGAWPGTLPSVLYIANFTGATGFAGASTTINIRATATAGGFELFAAPITISFI